jgi:hypothetical protein
MTDSRRAALLALALFALAYCLLAVPAHAHDAVLTWDHPTEYEDGQPLVVTDLRETRIEYARCDNQAFPAQPEGSLAVPAPATTASVAGFANGWWCFRAFAVTTEGVESSSSNVAVVHYVGKPKAPVLVAVQ